MRVIGVLCAVVCGCFLMRAGSPSSNGGGATGDDVKAGHLQLDSVYIDLGRVPRDSVAEATMGFVNTGEAPLQIMTVFSDCGCTSPEYSTDEVGPGEKGEIRVRFNSKNRREGVFRKTLRIRSNADNPRVTLVVKGIVK
ncbi:MAG: DUF1573 domain-containing protein [Muribaculaceae bacterium]|nr:DUF1573 domain-containing protein [Muribaculaceae bacterium]